MAELRERQKEEEELRKSPCWGSWVEEENCGVLPTPVGSPVSWINCGETSSFPFPTWAPQVASSALPISCHLPFQWHRCHSPLGPGPFRLTSCRDCTDGAFFTLGVLACDTGPGAGD